MAALDSNPLPPVNDTSWDDWAGALDTDVRALNVLSSTDLTDLAARWTPASTAGPAMLALAEDTDNGTNTVSLRAPISVASNITATLPVTTTILIGYDTVDTLTSKSIDGSSNTLTNIPQSAVTNLATDLGNKQPIDTDLTAIAAVSANGLITRTGAGTAAARTITGTSNRINVTNGDGVSANPTVDIGSDVAIIAGVQTLTNKTISGANNTLSNIPQSAVTSLTTDLGNKQPLDADLTDLVSKWTSASSTGPASLRFNEDTDTGTFGVILTAKSNLLGSPTVTLPESDTTLIGTVESATLTSKMIDFGSNSITTTLTQLNSSVSDADLVANGGGVATIRALTQVTYDAIGTKDPNTLYIII